MAVDVSFDFDWETMCSGYPVLPDMVSLAPGQSIIVIGDIHGDYAKLLYLLKTAKLIDEHNKWIGGNTIVVQVGDQIDSCRPGKLSCDHPDATPNDVAHDIPIMKFLTQLHLDAMVDGGAVYSLFGNHELLAVKGYTRYASKANVDALGGVEGYKEAFKPGGEMATFMGCTRQSAIIIGEYLFVHAGILPKVAKEYSIEKLNKLMRLYVLNKLEKASFNEVLNLMTNSNTSPFWQRILGKIPADVSISDSMCAKMIKPVLKIYGIKGMVIGHTPQFLLNNTANTTCGGALIRTDVGMSKAFDTLDTGNDSLRNAAAVKILNGDISIIN